MGRKRKIVNPEDSTKSLPPCRVCGAPGAGFHYGANTCEACKGFFHRSLRYHSQYKCDGNNHCIIEHTEGGKLCQLCRYEKCLAVGMAKEAIKTGRYTSAKKTKDILEVKRLEMTKKEQHTRPQCSSSENSQSQPFSASEYPPLSLSDSLQSQSTLSFSQACVQSSKLYDATSNSSSLSQEPLLTKTSFADALALSPDSDGSLPAKSHNVTVSEMAFQAADRVPNESSPLQGKLPQSQSPSHPGYYNFSSLSHGASCGPPSSSHDPLPFSTSLVQQSSSNFISNSFGPCPLETEPQNTSPNFQPTTSMTSSQDMTNCTQQLNSLPFSPIPICTVVDSPASQCNINTSVDIPGGSLLTSSAAVNDEVAAATTLMSLRSSSGSFPSSPASVSSGAYAASSELLSNSCSSSDTVGHSRKQGIISQSQGSLDRLYGSGSHSAPASQQSSLTVPDWSPVSGSPGNPSSSMSPSFLIESTLNRMGSESNLAPTPANMSAEHDTSTSSNDLVQVQEMYMDKEMVIKALVESHDRYLCGLFEPLSKEECVRLQNEHYEQCILKKEIFGELHKLDDTEYDEIFQSTGLDADNRRTLLSKLTLGMENVIRSMVKFAKCIPGFMRLDLKDKTNLIKFSRQEFAQYCNVTYMDCDRRILRAPDGTWKCHYEMIRFRNPQELCSSVFYDDYFEYMRRVQHLDLTREELIVLKAMVIMCPDRDCSINSALAYEIHWQLAQCFLYILGKRVPDSLRMFSQVVNCLTNFRSIEKDMLMFFRSSGLTKYSTVKDNPLLLEMLSGIMIDPPEAKLDIYPSDMPSYTNCS